MRLAMTDWEGAVFDSSILCSRRYVEFRAGAAVRDEERITSVDLAFPSRCQMHRLGDDELQPTSAGLKRRVLRSTCAGALISHSIMNVRGQSRRLLRAIYILSTAGFRSPTVQAVLRTKIRDAIFAMLIS
jgi:hypothetical protein